MKSVLANLRFGCILILTVTHTWPPKNKIVFQHSACMCVWSKCANMSIWSLCTDVCLISVDNSTFYHCVDIICAWKNTTAHSWSLWTDVYEIRIHKFNHFDIMIHYFIIVHIYFLDVNEQRTQNWSFWISKGTHLWPMYYNTRREKLQ